MLDEDLAESCMRIETGNLNKGCQLGISYVFKRLRLQSASALRMWIFLSSGLNLKDEQA